VLGRIFARNQVYTVTDTLTGLTDAFTIYTPDNLMGLAPDWGSRSVLSNPAVFRAVTLQAGLIGGFPWRAYSNYGGRQNEIVRSPLLEQPNPPEARAVTIGALVMDYLLNGNAVGLYTARNAEGYPTALVPVPADSVQVRLQSGRRVYRIGQQDYDQDDVFHAMGPSLPGDLRGLSRLELFTGTFRLASDQESAARSASSSGVPTGLLKVSNPDATVEDLRATKAVWMESQQRRTVAVLNSSTDFVPLSWNPTEAQLLEARRFSIQQVGLAFGVPLSFLGVEANSMTYTNAESVGMDLLKFTIGDTLVRFEQEFSKAHPRGTVVKANTDSLLRSDTQSRYSAHEIGIRAGFLTIDEARALEDRPPLEVDGD